MNLSRAKDLFAPMLFELKARNVAKRVGSSDPPRSEDADVRRVWDLVRPLLASDLRADEIDPTISSILRNPDFAPAWHNANRRMQVTRDELCSPQVPTEFHFLIGNYRNELQAVATAWGTVVRDVLDAAGPRPEIEKLGLGRTALPSYLDDDGLPIEVWETLLSRDIAAVSYLALIGKANQPPSAALGHFAHLHCHHQLRWLDLLSWMFDVPCPPMIPLEDRQPWAQFFDEHQAVERGLDALVRHGDACPGGFVLGDILPSCA